jgi:hypothetical protein
MGSPSRGRSLERRHEFDDRSASLKRAESIARYNMARQQKAMESLKGMDIGAHAMSSIPGVCFNF